jgi:hypothetical protein
LTTLRPLFVLSLPRAGSTLLQRILTAHSRISSTAEPWIMLPPLYSLRPDGAYSEYSHREVTRAVEDLIPRMRGGRRAYLDAIAEFGMRVYAQSAEPGAAYFLDKTPRYTLIAESLLETFPDGRFIVLWRNPLAVVASVVDTWAGGRWHHYRHKVDLYTGLERLTDAVAGNRDRVHTVRYEDLVSEPEKELAKLLAYLELDWQPDLVSAQRDVPLPGRLGDPSATARTPLTTASVDRWVTTFATPVRRRWGHRYLDWIGDARAATMGYDLAAIRRQLEGAPLRRGRLAPDLYDTGKGVLWSLAEPQIYRRKATLARTWRRVYSHT